MKVTLKNLGLLKQAEFTLGDLTIICGSNNMGKTYATYALFGFLYFWNEQLFETNTDEMGINIDIDDSKISELISNGTTIINLQEIVVCRFDPIIDDLCREYSKDDLSTVFATSTERFEDSEFKIDLDLDWDKFKIEYLHGL